MKSDDSIDQELTYSCQSSLQAGESLFATATRVDIWLGLEYEGPWENKAFEQSALPEASKEHLTSFLEATPHSRLVLIKSNASREEQGLSFFVALAREQSPALFRFRLSDYADLLSLDLHSIAMDAGSHKAERIQPPLYLICTNGRRDPCCAIHGLATYESLAQTVGPRAWQCTHLGGHRFAGTGMVLPYGLHYGRLRPEVAPRLVDAQTRGEILLDNFRGRSIYPSPVQAAEHHLRQLTGMLGVDQLRLSTFQAISGYLWEVGFESVREGGVYKVSVTAEQSAFRVFKTTADAEPAHVLLHRVTNVRRL